MEGLHPGQSILRPLEARRFLGLDFNIVIPEELQSVTAKKSDIYTRDIKAAKKSDIILADLYNEGFFTPQGEKLLERKLSRGKVEKQDMQWLSQHHTIKCHGTIEEIGYAKALKKYVVVIVRTTKNHHPFHEGADYIATSLEEACSHLKEKFDGH